MPKLVEGSNGACLKESQSFAFCGSQRSDGSWLCFDAENQSRGLDASAGTKILFVCDKQRTLFINLDQCQFECFILLGTYNPDNVPEIGGVTCDRL